VRRRCPGDIGTRLSFRRLPEQGELAPPSLVARELVGEQAERHRRVAGAPRRDRGRGDDLGIRIDRDVTLVPVEGVVVGLVTVPRSRVGQLLGTRAR
jgi:hypothetical protein